MPIRRGRLLAASTALLVAALGAPGLAHASSAGPDPSSNFPIGTLPESCWTAPTGAECVDASVSYLDQARASLGQPPYGLPKDFDSLTPAEQAFILTNDDRTMYGLPPVPGLTAWLNHDAADGVKSDNDPSPSSSNWWAYTANWAGGYENMVTAYEGWMYDDGPDSGNLDCTPKDSSGCWGHRDDVLWKFGSDAVLAMGAAAGTDSSGMSGYTMLLEQGPSGWSPNYVYTWAQAVADGAGGPSLYGSSPASTAGGRSAGRSVRIENLRVHRHRVSARITAPQSSAVHCLLMRRTAHGWRTIRARRCSHEVTFRHLRAGRYRLRISSSGRALVRRVIVH